MTVSSLFRSRSPVAAMHWRTALGSSLLIAMMSYQIATAQRPQPVVAPGPAAPRGVLVEIEEEAAVNVGDQHRTAIDENTLEQWALNGGMNAARTQHQAMIDLEINQIDAICKLSDEQKQMLKLAGAGEFQRAVDDLVMLQARAAGFTYDQNEVNELYQTLQPMRNRVQRRPLDPQSLVMKLLPSVLDPAQAERLQQWRDARERFQQRRAIAAAIAMIEQQVPLRDNQRQRLIELLKIEPRPGARQLVQPANRGNFVPPETVIHRLDMVAPEVLMEFLDDAQLEAMAELFLPRHRNAWRNLGRRLSKQQVERMLDDNDSSVPQATLDELNEQRQKLLNSAKPAASKENAAQPDPPAEQADAAVDEKQSKLNGADS